MKKIKLLRNYIPQVVLFAVAIGIVTLSSCNKDGEDDFVPTETTAEIIAGDETLSEFNGFVTADTELNGYLEGESEYTVFAPNNDAFDRLRTVLGVDDLAVIAPNVIGAVLRFHFSSGTQLKADLVGSSFSTVQGESSPVSTDGFIDEAGSDSDGSEILEADLKATNGVVHKVETILIPPTIFSAIGVNLQTLAQPVLLGANFTDVVGIINIADDDVPTGESSIATILADKSNSYTVFLPTNEVLAGVAAKFEISKENLIASLTETSADARDFILNHILEGDGLTKESLIANVNGETGIGDSFTMMSGKTMTVLYVPASEDTPAGCTNGENFCIFLAGEVGNAATYVPVFATDVYTTVDSEGVPLPGALNGSLHVSSVIQ